MSKRALIATSPEPQLHGLERDGARLDTATAQPCGGANHRNIPPRLPDWPTRAIRRRRCPPLPRDSAAAYIRRKEDAMARKCAALFLVRPFFRGAHTLDAKRVSLSEARKPFFELRPLGIGEFSFEFHRQLRIAFAAPDSSRY
jgi:hypothetical protein